MVSVSCCMSNGLKSPVPPFFQQNAVVMRTTITRVLVHSGSDMHCCGCVRQHTEHRGCSRCTLMAAAKS